MGPLRATFLQLALRPDIPLVGVKRPLLRPDVSKVAAGETTLS